MWLRPVGSGGGFSGGDMGMGFIYVIEPRKRCIRGFHNDVLAPKFVSFAMILPMT
jgi:hypothetical protein